MLGTRAHYSSGIVASLVANKSDGVNANVNVVMFNISVLLATVFYCQAFFARYLTMYMHLLMIRFK